MATIRTTNDNLTNPADPDYKLPLLPLNIDLETKLVLKKLKEASRALAELKGVALNRRYAVALSMPNQSILINTLSLQEAKDSSAIENIITTHDELYRSSPQLGDYASLAAKEVHQYASAWMAMAERGVSLTFSI